MEKDRVMRARMSLGLIKSSYETLVEEIKNTKVARKDYISSLLDGIGIGILGIEPLIAELKEGSDDSADR